MTLQTSGAISLLDIRNEYGGAAPDSLSEYYRLGSYVKEYINEEQMVTEGPFGESGYNVSGNGRWEWNSVVIATGNTNSSLVHGDWTYYRGSAYFVGSFVTLYRISREQMQTVTVEINRDVPTSGVISLSDFYGGRGGGYNGVPGFPIQK